MYGYQKTGSDVEVITIRLRAIAKKRDLNIPFIQNKKNKINPAMGKMIFNGKRIDIKVYNRNAFYSGYKFNGPALILEDTSTTFITPKFKCSVDDWGNIIAKI